MMLAGVTGVMWASSCELMCDGTIGAVNGEEELMPGGAGGGIDRSTGEGESFSATVLFLRPLDERSKGVEVADFTLRAGFFGTVGVGVGVGRFLLV